MQKTNTGYTKKEVVNAIKDRDKYKNEENDRTDKKDINIYLFFDLLQISKTILQMTDQNNIIILIGDTPSYLKPFMENERKIYSLAFSNKAYFVTKAPYTDRPGYACVIIAL